MENTRSFTYEEVLLAADDVSFWLKDAIRSTADRDPVDVLRDAQALVEVAKARLTNVQRRFIDSERVILRRAA